MTDNSKGTALVERQPSVIELAGVEIKTPQDYADRIRELQGQAHILSPMAAVASIAPSHTINTMVVAIDASVDPKSGRGADVYFQSAIHKSRKVGAREYEPLEVSLNKVGLGKILSASGANVYPPQREFRERYWWIVSHEADLLTFDGRIVRMPPGTASVDLRDGSADIGEWTPEAWVEAVRVAEEQKKRTQPDDQWKIKASVGGWTKDRVIQARKYGLEMAETKSLNRLARNLGIRQTYTIEELARPFVIFRAAYVPDTSDPEVRRMLTAASLGVRSILYPGAQAQQVPLHDVPVSHGIGDPNMQIEGEAVHEPEPPERMETAAPPEDAEELVEEQPPAKSEPAQPADTYHVTKLLKKGKDAAAQYFVETQEGVTLYTPDAALLKPLQAAAKDKLPREIPTERVMVGGKAYRQIVEIASVGGLKL